MCSIKPEKIKPSGSNPFLCAEGTKCNYGCSLCKGLISVILLLCEWCLEDVSGTTDAGGWKRHALLLFWSMSDILEWRGHILLLVSLTRSTHWCQPHGRWPPRENQILIGSQMETGCRRLGFLVLTKFNIWKDVRALWIELYPLKLGCWSPNS